MLLYSRSTCLKFPSTANSFLLKGCLLCDQASSSSLFTDRDSLHPCRGDVGSPRKLPMSRRLREDAHFSYRCCFNSLLMKQGGRTKIVHSDWHLNIIKCVTGLWYIYLRIFKKGLWQYMKHSAQKMVFQLDDCSQTKHTCIRKQILTALQEFPSSSLSVTTPSSNQQCHYMDSE